MIFILNNIMITALICFRLIRQRRMVARLLPSEQLTVYTRVIVVLIEAAVPVTVFGIGYAIALLISHGSEGVQSGFIGKAIANHFFATFYFLFAVSFLVLSWIAVMGRY